MSPRTSDVMTICFGFPLEKGDLAASHRERRRALRRDWVRAATSGLDRALNQRDYAHNPLGKPYFRNGPFLSISHCDLMSATVISHSSELGLDVQRFSTRHIASFNSYFRTDLAAQDAANIWVRMEAIAKFLGKGLGHGLDHLFALATGVEPCAGFKVKTLNIDDFKCAVCVDADHPLDQIQTLHWQGTLQHA